MKKYLITSREFYTDTPVTFSKILSEQFISCMPDFALYRDKINPNYARQAKYFVALCSQFKSIKSFIHQDVDLALKLGADGVHLTSNQFDKIEYAKSLGLEVIISTHSYDEVFNAKIKGADYVTYSPIFSSPNKGKPKGIKDLELLLKKTDMKIFALGGIVDLKEIEQIAKTNTYGFASIRYFYNCNHLE